MGGSRPISQRVQAPDDRGAQAAPFDRLQLASVEHAGVVAELRLGLGDLGGEIGCVAGRRCGLGSGDEHSHAGLDDLVDPIPRGVDMAAATCGSVAAVEAHCAADVAREGMAAGATDGEAREQIAPRGGSAFLGELLAQSLIGHAVEHWRPVAGADDLAVVDL